MICAISPVDVNVFYILNPIVVVRNEIRIVVWPIPGVVMNRILHSLLIECVAATEDRTHSRIDNIKDNENNNACRDEEIYFYPL
jgi:hypothetical protein